MGRGDESDAPVTTRLGRAGGSDRRLRLAIAFVGVGLALAVLKPWDLLPSAPPTPDDARRPPGPSPAATPGSTPWTQIGDELACFSGRTWMAVVDERDDGRVTRSWTSLEPVPASGPADPAIVGTHAYAEAVLRLGFCAPAARAAEGATREMDVELWRLAPAGVDGDAREVPRRLVAGGTVAAGGALYVPGGPINRRDRTSEALWPPGTYVFRIRLAGAGPDDAGTSWFAVELRGPWPGPDRTSPPSPAPAPTPAPASPG